MAAAFLPTPIWNELSSIWFSKPTAIDSPGMPGSSRYMLADAALGSAIRKAHVATSAPMRVLAFKTSSLIG